jgi:hypothetical protein
MVSLIDIVPQTRTVQIASGDLTLRGLGLRQIADLLVRFPTLRNLFVFDGALALDVDTLIRVAPDAIGAIVAEAAGQPEAAESVAEGLPLNDIAECLLTVLDLTMPNGPSPFLGVLTKLLGTGADSPAGRAQDTISQPVPNGSLPADMLPAK